MAPRKSELPEGTDHIINGAMETGAGTGASTGSGTGGGSSSGFIGTGSTTVIGDDTGGTTAQGSRRTGVAVDQLKSGAQNLRDQATSKAREYAVEGKTRATTALDDFSGVLRDTAVQIDERLGSEYGQYARRAADGISSFADNVRGKDVDQLFDDAKEVVRKSPMIAIGTAAAIGFALVRLIKAGASDSSTDVAFKPDPAVGGTKFESDAPEVTPRPGA